MNLVGRLRAAKKADAKAAATAPARFRRITKRTRITSPCVMIDVNTSPIVATVYRVAEHGEQMKGGYTHYLPIEFPEVRG